MEAGRTATRMNDEMCGEAKVFFASLEETGVWHYRPEGIGGKKPGAAGIRTAREKKCKI